MPGAAYALTQRDAIQDPAVVEELDRFVARFNGAMAGLGQNNPEADLELGIDRGSGVQLTRFADLTGPFILAGRSISLSSDIASLDPADDTVLRITPAAANRTVQGIRGGSDRRILIIYVPSSASYTLTLANESSSADAEKRIQLVGDANLTSVVGEARGWILQYDAADKQWVQLGGSAAIGAVGPIDVSTTSTPVTNTTTETSVYSFAVPANTLAAGRGLRFTMKGMYQKTAGAGASFSVKVTFGGTTLVSGAVATGLGSTANKRSTRVTCEISAVGASDQRAITRVLFGNNATGSAAWESTSTDNIAYHDTLALDLTTALTLEVLVTHSVADAGISFTKDFAVVELLQ